MNNIEYITNIEYIEDLRKELCYYISEHNQLVVNCKIIENKNIKTWGKILYYADKLKFKNVTNSSTANFISVNTHLIGSYLYINTIEYEKNRLQLELLKDRLSFIKFSIQQNEWIIQFIINK